MSTEIAASHKKTHKPRAKTLALWDAILQVVSQHEQMGIERMTVRQLYYQMEMLGFIGKSQQDYDKVQRACVQMRRQGKLPYEKIVDSVREWRAIHQYSGL